MYERLGKSTNLTNHSVLLHPLCNFQIFIIMNIRRTGNFSGRMQTPPQTVRKNHIELNIFNKYRLLNHLTLKHVKRTQCDIKYNLENEFLNIYLTIRLNYILNNS